jgi:hypothetical protein
LTVRLVLAGPLLPAAGVALSLVLLTWLSCLALPSLARATLPLASLILVFVVVLRTVRHC